MLFKRQKSAVPTLTVDELPELTAFLAGHGFSRGPAFTVGAGERSGRWLSYSSSRCDLAFGMADNPFWASDSYLIGDPGSLANGSPKGGVSLSNYLPAFYDRMQGARQRHEPLAKAITCGLGDDLEKAIALFTQLRAEGRWLPRRAERLQSGLEV